MAAMCSRKMIFSTNYFLPMHQSLFELVVKCLGTMIVSLSYEELISFFCFYS